MVMVLQTRQRRAKSTPLQLKISAKFWGLGESQTLLAASRTHKQTFSVTAPFWATNPHHTSMGYLLHIPYKSPVYHI